MNFDDQEEKPKGVIYYTIYLKNLANGSGYIDVALAGDQLLKDYLQYLDVGIKPVRTYVVTMPPKADGMRVDSTGVFAINMADVMAVATVKQA